MGESYSLPRGTDLGSLSKRADTWGLAQSWGRTAGAAVLPRGRGSRGLAGGSGAIVFKVRRMGVRGMEKADGWGGQKVQTSNYK